MPEDKWADRRKLAGDARDAAIRRLKAAHLAEYQSYYREEAERRGVKPRAMSREEKRARLLAELERLN